MRLSRDVSGIQVQSESDFNINVEFLIGPGFQGSSHRRVQQADRLLKIQAAVTVDPPDDPHA